MQFVKLPVLVSLKTYFPHCFHHKFTIFLKEQKNWLACVLSSKYVNLVSQNLQGKASIRDG